MSVPARARARQPGMGPRIISIALNELNYDQRVRQVASSLAALGAEVTVLGMTFEAHGWERGMDGVRIRVIAAPRARSRLAPRLGGTAAWTARAAAGITARLKQRRLEARAGLRQAEAAGSPEAIRRARSLLVRRRAGRTTRLRLAVARRLAGAARAQSRWENSLRRRARRKGRSFVRARPRLIRAAVRCRPDAIHANDAETLPIALAARRRLLLRGVRPKLVYDAHEWTVGRTAYLTPSSARPSEVRLEGAGIPRVDAVITVGDVLAERLRERYGLARAPTVVHSAPRRQGQDQRCLSIRELAGVSPESAILVYVGRVAPRRGVFDAVSALPLLPEAAELITLGPITAGVEGKLMELAADHGLTDRVTCLQPVAPEKVVATIRDATLGLIPLQRNEQHEVAMPSKLFQYVRAGLPVVTSNCLQLAEFVDRHGIGEVCEPEDPTSLAAAIERALGRRDLLRRNLRRPSLLSQTTWEAQEDRLLSVYRGLGVLG